MSSWSSPRPAWIAGLLSWPCEVLLFWGSVLACKSLLVGDGGDAGRAGECSAGMMAMLSAFGVGLDGGCTVDFSCWGCRLGWGAGRGKENLLRGSSTRLQSFEESSKRVFGVLDRAIELEFIRAQTRQICTNL